MKIIGYFKDLLTNSEGNSIVSFLINNYQYNHLLKTLDPNKTYSIEIRERKPKRSLDQNRLMWKLISEIDLKMNGRKSDSGAWDIYLTALERANIKSEYIACLPKAEQAIKEQFRAVKLSHTMEFKGVIYNVYKCYIGSSKMDTKEFSDLIETVLDMAQEVDIPTAYWNEVLR